MLFELMGFGRPVDSFDVSRSSAHLLRSFGPPLGVLAAAAGRPIDRWSTHGEVAVARRTERLAAGELAAGMGAAQRTAIVGHQGGAEVGRFTPAWYWTPGTEPEWGLRPARGRGRAARGAP